MKARFNALKKNAYGRIAVLFVVCLFPFSLARALLFGIYHSDFAQLGAFDVVLAFIVGLRFDASITAMALGLPLVMILLPFKFAHRGAWQTVWGWVGYAMLVLLIFMLAADLFYFEVVRRHAGPEVSALAADIPSMIYLAVHDFPWGLTVFIIAAIGGAYIWRTLIFPLPTPPAYITRRLAGIVVLMTLLVFIGRGGLQYKPLSVADAFISDSPATGYLVLNGPFSLAHAMENEKPLVKDFMSTADATRITQAWLGGQNTHFIDAHYPLLRNATNIPRSSPPNIVVLLLESWDASNVDAMRVAAGKSSRGVTPNFDRLARQGRLYTNFFAVGQRSIEGIAGMLAGMPTTPGMPPLGLGMEQNRLSFLGELAKSQAYRTVFLQSSNRGSFHVDAIAKRAGFDTYLGSEDIPELHLDKRVNAGWGTWDHNTLQAANDLFQNNKTPFLGFIFTSSTHTPYATPTEQWRKFNSQTEHDKFLNTLYYSDWALGEFIAAAQRAGYFENTLFVLTGDHVSAFVEDSEQTPNRYRIPLLIVGPGITPGVDTRVGGHLDILPTVVDAAGWSAHYAVLGRSLLDDTRMQDRTAFSVRATLVDWIAHDGWMTHDLNKRLGVAPELPAARAVQMEQQLTAVFQIVSHALVENRVDK